MATAPSISIINTLTMPQRAELLAYAKSCAIRNAGPLADFRTLLRYRDRAYQRQLNVTAEHIKAVRANMSGDARKLQDITVPIVMPQIESAVAYQAGVYLTSYPIFGVVSYPKNQSAALQFETALGDQSIRYGWARELIKTFRNGFKYNFGAAVVTWKKTPLKQVVTDTSISAAGMAKLNEYSYGGNCIENIDPYNCFMDMTVAPADMHTDGEFFGYNKIISRIQLKKLFATLDANKTTNAKEAFESQFVGASQDSGDGMAYHTPEINQYLNLSATNYTSGNWGQWMGLPGTNNRSSINYKDNYVITHFYCRALPSDFGARGNQAKVYHGILINWQYCIFAEEMNTAHDLLPCMIMQPYEDGLGYQTQSMLDNALPFQDMSSSLWNISLESKRRLIFDRLIYNPRLIDKKDIDPISSVSRIPLRNAGAVKDGNDMQRAIYQIPYREDNSSSNIQMSDMISAMADSASGQNKVDRGQFQKGNKTKTEFDQTMSNSNSRQQLASLTIEQQFMTPVKEIIKSNTLQYQPAGTLLNRDQRAEVAVDPVELRKSILEFKMTDGNLPADKLMNTEILTVFMQTAQAIPTLTSEYDILGMFLYFAKLRGAYWLEDFKRNPQQQQEFMNTMAQTTAASNPQVQAAQAQAANAP
jgi:hypothetical protein